jgi:hypothetical protein
MSIKIEFRYAVLTSLLVMLWLVLEYMVGLQDTFIAWHPYVTLVVMLGIDFATYRLALKEKLEQKFGKLSLRQAFISGVILTIFSCILAVPLQMAFIKLINPDFFQIMIAYTAKAGKVTMEQAAQYINPGTYIAESVLETFIFGIIISLILAFRMRAIK